MITAEQASMDGADFLDKADPGWHRYVDADSVRMCDGRKCILGQRYGHYIEGLLRLRLNQTDVIGLGFLTFVVGESWDELDVAWGDRVRDRQRADDLLGEYEGHTEERVY